MIYIFYVLEMVKYKPILLVNDSAIYLREDTTAISTIDCAKKCNIAFLKKSR